MPLTGNVAHDIKTEMAHGKPQKQAVAIAMDVARRSGGNTVKSLAKSGKRK